VVSVTDPYCRILGILYKKGYNIKMNLRYLVYELVMIAKLF
jgi:hypothetical protein